MTKNRNYWLGITLLFSVSLAVQVEARWYVSPEFGNPEKRPQVLVLLPPHAELIKQKVVMTEEMVSEALALEVTAASATLDFLTSKGYQVTQLTPDRINADPELQELILKVNRRYSEEWPKIIRKPKQVRYGRYSMGDELRSLAKRLGADAIVFARIQGVEVSVGKAVMGAVMGALIGGGGGSGSYARMDICVVNAQSAKIEGYFDGRVSVGLHDLTENAEKATKKLAKKTLKKYPNTEKVVKVRISKKDKIEAEEPTADEDAVLAELEALLGEPE